MNEIPKTILDKASDGGYDFSEKLEYNQSRFLDPLFWKALGKACGWEDDTQYDLTVAILFYEKNLTEGYDEAIKWLESILPTPNVSNDM